jgi:hypothetical protein
LINFCKKDKMKKQSTLSLSPAKGVLIIDTLFYWKVLQFIFWIVGIALLSFMFFMPPVGVMLFWNILIPVAPALLVIGTGAWRNVCPLATTALIPDRIGLSKKKKLSNKQRSVLNLIGVIVLLLVIPLRHVIFNRSGEGTALLIVSISLIAFAIGMVYERKSGWCSGVCPVHGVERLYGSGVAFSLPNTQCKECVKCSVPCPDSTPNATVQTSPGGWAQKGVEYILVGAFPGYIWGWFHIPDYTGTSGWNHLLFVYGIPVLSAIISLDVYLILKQFVFHEGRKLLVSLFAAAAVSCYYWFRLPQLLGFNVINTNGTLIDLSNVLPVWTPIVLNIITTTFFIWWMVIRDKSKRAWSIRPAYAKK